MRIKMTRVCRAAGAAWRFSNAKTREHRPLSRYRVLPPSMRRARAGSMNRPVITQQLLDLFAQAENTPRKIIRLRVP